MKCVVFFSGGLMSFMAALRAIRKYGAENVVLLFTDTLIEDADLYRFLVLAAAVVFGRRLNWDIPALADFPPTFLDALPGQEPKINPAWLDFLAALRERVAQAVPELVWIADGRTPWEVFRDEKTIGNTRRDPCSKILKRLIGRAWLAANCDPDSTALVFGIHYEEKHRYEGTRWDKKAKAHLPSGVKNTYARLGWPHVEAPMCASPYLTENDIRAWVRVEGLHIPRLYDLGFSHNNCGGFCVKAGEGHFAKLLIELPEVYAHHEAQEDAFNAARPGKRRQTVLAPELPDPERPGKVKRVPMSMREFREGMEAKALTINMFNVGGCGCFLEEAA